MWWRTCVLVINGISETLPEQHRAAAFALLKFANGRNENQRSRRQFSANKPVSLQLHERSLFNISALIPPTARAPFYFKTTWEKKSDAEREQTGLAWLDSLLSRSPSKFILMPTFCLKKNLINASGCCRDMLEVSATFPLTKKRKERKTFLSSFVCVWTGKSFRWKSPTCMCQSDLWNQCLWEDRMKGAH